MGVDESLSARLQRSHQFGMRDGILSTLRFGPANGPERTVFAPVGLPN